MNQITIETIHETMKTEFRLMTERHTRLEQLLIALTPARRLPAAFQPQAAAMRRSGDLAGATEREEALLRIFGKLFRLERWEQRNQKFPEALWQPIPGQGQDEVPPREAVPYSILVNRCHNLKTFRATGDEKSAEQNVIDCLELCGDLVISTMEQAGFSESKVRIVMSKAEAERCGVVKPKKRITVIPDEFDELTSEFHKLEPAETFEESSCAQGVATAGRNRDEPPDEDEDLDLEDLEEDPLPPKKSLRDVWAESVEDAPEVPDDSVPDENLNWMRGDDDDDLEDEDLALARDAAEKLDAGVPETPVKPKKIKITKADVSPEDLKKPTFENPDGRCDLPVSVPERRKIKLPRQIKK